MGLRIVNDTLKPDKEIEDNEEDDWTSQIQSQR
jgi:hypothetical protein